MANNIAACSQLTAGGIIAGRLLPHAGSPCQSCVICVGIATRIARLMRQPALAPHHLLCLHPHLRPLQKPNFPTALHCSNLQQPQWILVPLMAITWPRATPTRLCWTTPALFLLALSHSHSPVPTLPRCLCHWSRSVLLQISHLLQLSPGEMVFCIALCCFVLLSASRLYFIGRADIIIA